MRGREDFASPEVPGGGGSVQLKADWPKGTLT